MRLGIVVNQPGVQDARAIGIVSRLPEEVQAEVLTCPSPLEVLRRSPTWDAVYVIDPGRRGMPAAVVSRLRAIPTFVEIGDPQGALYDAQSRSPWAIGLGRLIDWTVVRGASGIVFRGAGLAATLRPRSPWTYIPDGVDLELFRPANGRSQRQRLGLPGDALVAGVVGSVNWSEARGSAYGLELVNALAHLRGRPVWMLIVGGGDGLPRLRERAAELGVSDRVIMTGRRPHDEVPALLNAMDVCVSTQSDDAVGRGRTTAKLPEYLACDRFVLASPVGTAADLLPREMLLERGEAGDRDHAMRVAQRLAALVPRRAALASGAGTRSLAEQHFGYQRITDHLMAFIRSVIAR